MHTRKSTTGYAMVMARIAVVVIAFVLGHDAMMAANPHAAPVEAHTSHIETMIEECTLVEGQVQHASVQNPFSWEIDFATTATTILWADDLTPVSGESAAPPQNATMARIAMQVFLN